MGLAEVFEVIGEKVDDADFGAVAAVVEGEVILVAFGSCGSKYIGV